MKKSMINYIKAEKNDEFFTPNYAIGPLVEYISSDLVVWEPTDPGDSKITSVFKQNGNKVIGTHVRAGANFFEYTPDFHFDIIITNPPFSLKTEFIKKCYEIGKPFALLLPITTLEGKERGKIFQENGIEVLVLDKRVEFIKGKTNWFNTSWFCKNVLPKELIFKKVDKVKL